MIKIKIHICVMSNEQQEHEKERVPFVTRFLLCTMGDINILICELFYMYSVIEDHCMWSYMLYVFPLSNKLIRVFLSM